MDAEEVDVSVVVPCYEAARTLRPCLESLLAQATSQDYEVIVVENGSSDETLAVARSLEKPGGVLRVVHEEKPGSYAARNRGLAEARGRYVLFTDADCRAGPGWIEAMARALGDETVVLVGGEVRGAAEQGCLLARYARSIKILSQSHTLRHPRGGFLQTANLGVRRADCEAVGGFDGELYAGGDADFCWRLRRHRPEAVMRVIPDAEVEHFDRETLREFSRQYFRYGQADVVLGRKHGIVAVHTLVKLLVDVLRVVLLPLWMLLGAVQAVFEGDLLPLVSPFIRALRVSARRSGQLLALLRPGKLRRA